jgi:hypothetical protein
MKLLPALFLMAVASTALAADDVVFREPFTLRLHLDKEHYVQYPIGKVPFVHNGAVYLYNGESFGLHLNVEEGAVKSLGYTPDAKTADVSLDFTQKIKEDGSSMMLLTIVNHTKYKLAMQALMVTPNSKQPTATSIIPVEPGMTNFESWPHPIAQLVLHKLKVQM